MMKDKELFERWRSLKEAGRGLEASEALREYIAGGLEWKPLDADEVRAEEGEKR